MPYFGANASPIANIGNAWIFLAKIAEIA